MKWKDQFAKWVEDGNKSPLMVLLEEMINTTDVEVRIDCAKAAAPYCHPKLAAHIVRHDDGSTNHEDWLRSVEGINAPKLVTPPKDMTDDDLGAVQHKPIVIDHE